jgi:hypothetical protein
MEGRPPHQRPLQQNRHRFGNVKAVQSATRHDSIIGAVRVDFDLDGGD